MNDFYIKLYHPTYFSHLISLNIINDDLVLKGLHSLEPPLQTGKYFISIKDIFLKKDGLIKS